MIRWSEGWKENLKTKEERDAGKESVIFDYKACVFIQRLKTVNQLIVEGCVCVCGSM